MDILALKYYTKTISSDFGVQNDCKYNFSNYVLDNVCFTFFYLFIFFTWLDVLYIMFAQEIPETSQVCHHQPVLNRKNQHLMDE